MINQCPTCQIELDWVDGHYHCPKCATTYSKHAFCQTCASELERLAACGAVSYFCPQCKGLASKSLAKYEFRPLVK